MKILRPTILGLLFAIALASLNHIARPVIAANQHDYTLQTIRALASPRQIVETETGYQIIAGDTVWGRVTPIVTTEGYNGEIRLLMATDTSNSIAGLTVVYHRETPGLGDVIEGDWIRQFENRSLENSEFALAPSGHIDGITGATITSEAIVKAVDMALAESSQR